MLKSKTWISLLLFFAFKTASGQNIINVNHFDKVIVSPHIEVTFIEGNEEKVTIEKSTVSDDKINIEVNGKTLRIYLDDAKEVEKTQTVYENGNKVKRPIYKGTVVTATVIYKTLVDLSVRGEETIVCQSLLKGEKFDLKIYGESDVVLNEVSLGKLKTILYGESNLIIKAGSVKEQKYTAYGESKINSLGIDNELTKITAYGESNFKINASQEIKLTAFGEAAVEYKGNPIITKGLKVGEIKISKID
jgi:hypothetical protein